MRAGALALQLLRRSREKRRRSYMLFVLSACKSSGRFGRFGGGYLSKYEEFDEGANKDDNRELAKQKSLSE